MYCVSVSHKKTPASVRARFAMDKKQQTDMILKLTAQEGIDGCVVLCTCNRSEIYVSGGREAVKLLKKELSKVSQVSEQELLRYLNTYGQEQAVGHLFKVCCGFDSMVLGEDEILGQAREAYQASLALKATGHELNRLFQRAIACAKQIRTDTKISTTPLSVATLVANEVFRFEKESQEKEKKVMIIGITGKMGMTIAKNIISKPGIYVTGTIRSHGSQLFFGPGGDRVSLVEYRERYRHMEDMDIVVSATTSPHYTVTKEALKKVWTKGKKHLLIDVSVPLDIDPECEMISGATLHNIDYFEALSKNNKEIRLQELDRAALIMEEKMDEALREELFHPYIRQMGEIKEALAGKSIESLLFSIRDHVSSEELKVILKTLDGLRQWQKED